MTRRPQLRVPVACWVIATAILLLVGCGSGTAEPEPEPEPEPDAIAAAADAAPDATRVVDAMVAFDAEPDATEVDAIPPHCPADGTVLVDGGGGFSEIVMHEGRVYWVDEGTEAAGFRDGAVRSVSKFGGDVTTHAMGQLRPKALAVDASHVYWVNFGTTVGNQTDGNGELMRAALDGSDPETLARSISRPRAITLDDKNVYFAQERGTGATDDWELWRLAKLGGEPIPLASGEPTISVLVVDSGFLYWSTFGDGVRRVRVGGGEPDWLAAYPRLTTGISIVDRYVYYLEFTGRFLRVDQVSGVQEYLTPQQNVQPLRLAMDGEFAYWTSNLGFIYQVAADGGTPVPILSAPQGFGIVVDEQCIYWSLRSGGIMMARKP